MKYSIFFLCCLQSLSALGQHCKHSLTGYVIDQSTGIPLEFANIFVEETGSGTITDSTGFFQLGNLCQAAYHVRISHLGCEPESKYIALQRDTLINIYMSHHAELLDEVVVHGSPADKQAGVSSTISKEAITESGNKNISDILSSIAGVSVLRNGSGISKPVVHGLYGNRISILNNGILQSGQQWGNDHAPEIDPFVADHLSVVKGAASLAYGGNSLGGVVLVESAKIADDPHLHGSMNYYFQSNGLGHTLNGTVQKYNDWAAWRVTGTYKRQGDMRSPDYYLTNTGNRETNVAVQLEKDFRQKWQTELYYSLFNTEIGILRGSHISNLTDLQSAIGRAEPFFTADNFSYEINAPRQEVTHHLLKLESKYFIDDEKVLKLKYGGQLNQRKEFDIRRGGRSDIPALSLQQQSHSLETVFDLSLRPGMLLTTGLQFGLTDNTNAPETGILPLIPDYRSYTTAGFAIFKHNVNRWAYELGSRYDYIALEAITITNTLPRKIVRFDHHFFNYSFSGGVKYKSSKSYSSSLNVGYLLRSPEVNELYSAGLHQGVSGIEEGNNSLAAERSLKFILSNDWQVRERLFVQSLFYFQNIEDYIYLQPQSEFRLTIRGAFPVFIYQQTDANIYGMDWLLKFEPGDHWKLVAKYAFIRGKDLNNKVALINIPSDNINGTLTYNFKGAKILTNSHLATTGTYVFRQDDIDPSQDFTQVPDAYFLLGLQAGTTLQFHESSLKILLKAENILNRRYRDYLNRLRYFSDEPGINCSVNLQYKF